MNVEININGKTIVIPVDVAEVFIEDTYGKVQDREIVDALILLSKIQFIQKYLNLNQLEYLCETLPDSVYWETNICGICQSQVDFDVDSIPNWSFDEVKSIWICPECHERGETENDDDGEDDQGDESKTDNGGVTRTCPDCGEILDVNDEFCPHCAEEEVEEAE